jgi:hypothetical protein
MLQISIASQNARLDSLETVLGTAPRLEIRTGSPAASCAATASGSVLATLTLPNDWAANASGGTKTIANGPWTGTASGAGTAGHFRMLDSAGTTCHQQGTVAVSGSDMVVDNVVFAVGQTFNVIAYSITDGNG